VSASHQAEAESDCSAQLELCNVVQEYTLGGQRVRALNDITLSIASGEFVSLIGPSGAGKSTMLHLMGALDAPSSGRVLLAGNDLAHLGDNQLADIRRRKVGFVFQFFNLLPMLSAWENVAVPLLLEGVRLRRTKSRAVDLLERVGLGTRIDHRPGELSGGQMQRVAIARALIMDPVVILADEPTGNLDSDTGTQIVQLLSEIAHDISAEHAVVMATHSLDAARWADRTVLLVDGTVTADSTPEEVLQTFAGSALKVTGSSLQRHQDGEPTHVSGAP
jgi:putative ABC transport system ATP-binding protein